MVGKEDEEVNMPLYRDRDAGWGWRPSDAASCRVGELSGLGLENPRAQGRIGGLGSAPRHLWPEGRGKEAALNLHCWRPQLSRGPPEPHPGLPSRTPGRVPWRAVHTAASADGSPTRDPKRSGGSQGGFSDADRPGVPGAQGS